MADLAQPLFGNGRFVLLENVKEVLARMRPAMGETRGTALAGSRCKLIIARVAVNHHFVVGLPEAERLIQ